MNKIVGDFRGQEKRIGSSRAEAVFAKFRSGKRTNGDEEHIVDLIVRGEESFFVFLQVALVAGGQTFERSEQAEQRAGNAAQFSRESIPSCRDSFSAA